MTSAERRVGVAVSAFRAAFGHAPEVLVHAPGRVNIIGEHIDYCGLAVLPFALERGVTVAFTPRADDLVRVATALPGLAAVEFRRTRIEPGAAGDWGNYVKAAVLAVTPDRAAGRGEDGPPPRGFEALVGTDLPVAAGLSSSSALVVACALAARVADEPGAAADWSDAAAGLDRRLEMASRLARGERFVGTAGGGMDQAACLLARRGHALRISFEPLAATPVPLPSEWQWVVAHSGQRAEKSGAAQATYNARTREAETARARIAAARGRPAARWSELLAPRASAEMLAAADALPAPLGSRARHIVSEAGRVDQMEAAIGRADIAGAGRLLLESHASLRDNYEVSTLRLDSLVERAVAAGSVGARLTGAGLGGSIVALVAADRAERVREALVASTGDADPVFIATPGDGARARTC